MPQPSASPSPHAAQLNLPANGTRIVFLHAHDTGLRAPCAVQVDVKTPQGDRESEQDISTEISVWLCKDVRMVAHIPSPYLQDLLVKLVVSHLRTPLPVKFIIDGDSYTITATRKKWKYGQKKLLMTWGDERIVPCEDKWTFLLCRRALQGCSA